MSDLSEKCLGILKEKGPMPTRELLELLPAGVNAHEARLALMVLKRAGQANVAGKARAAQWTATGGKVPAKAPRRTKPKAKSLRKAKGHRPPNPEERASDVLAEAEGARVGLRLACLRYASGQQRIAALVGDLLTLLGPDQ